LDLPAEPTDLRDELRDSLLAEHDWTLGFSDDIRFAVWLWGEWQPVLEPVGFGREEFVDAVADYRRETWLWLIGDRVWSQFMGGLAGRIARRAPGILSTSVTD
jgi:hypothetical protein